MKYTPLFLITALMLMGTGCTGESKKGQKMEKPTVGNLAPDFTLPDFTTGTVEDIINTKTHCIIFNP